MVKVYLIDDNVDLLFTYECLLNSIGIDVIEKALDGEEAVYMYKNFIEKPNLILLDYRMPKKNGLEIMNDILKINTNAIIIFISADSEIAKDAIEKGAKSFLKKPVSAINFLDEIKIHLNI